MQLILPGALHVHHALHIAVLEFGEEPVEDLEILADVLRVLRERAEALLAQQHAHLEINSNKLILIPSKLKNCCSMMSTFSRDLVTALASGRMASDSRSLFMMEDPAARHSAPNQSCPARLSVMMSSAKGRKAKIHFIKHSCLSKRQIVVTIILRGKEDSILWSANTCKF